MFDDEGKTKDKVMFEKKREDIFQDREICQGLKTLGK